MTEIAWQHCGVCGAPMFRVRRDQRTLEGADIECANTECEHGLVLGTNDIQLDPGESLVFALGGRFGVRLAPL